MNSVNYLIPAAIATFSLAGAVGANAEDRFHEPNRYAATNLVSDLAGKAKVRDPILQNACDGDGTIVALQVKIPLPGGKVPATACQHANSATKTPAAPTGLVWNATTKFLVPGTKLPAAFIFDTEDGTISAWAGGLTPFDAAVLAVDNSSVPNTANGAVYKGLAFGTNVNGVFLFATNFRAGTIDVFARPPPAALPAITFRQPPMVASRIRRSHWATRRSAYRTSMATCS